MFEFWFKYPHRTFADGEFYFASGWPLWGLILAGIGLSALIAFSLYRSRNTLSGPQLASLWILQSTLLVAVLLMLWQPALRVFDIRKGENRLALLLDTSVSMSYAENNVSRLQNILSHLQPELQTSLGKLFDAEWYSVSDKLSPLNTLEEIPEPVRFSHIGESLLKTLETSGQQALSAVVLFSDGSDNGVAAKDPAWWRKLSQYAIPVHTVGVGRDSLAEDLELVDVRMSESTLQGTIETVRISVLRGHAEKVNIKVYNKEKLLISEELGDSERPGISHHLLDLPPMSSGLHQLKFVLQPWDDELNVRNNEQHRLLHVVENPKRVLYVEGEPRWEYKFIRRALSDHPGIRLVSILRTSPNKYYRQGVESSEELAGGFPTDKESLFEFDAVILGSLKAAQLSQQQQEDLSEFVSVRGGSLLMLAGRNALADGGWGRSELAKTIPVILPDQAEPTFIPVKAKVTLNEAGSFSSIVRLAGDKGENRRLWDEMPAVDGYQYIGKLKPGGRSLLDAEVDGQRLPLLVSQRFGYGYTYVLATAGTWRWQMQLPSTDLRHEKFWLQLCNALIAPSLPMLSTEADPGLSSHPSVTALRIEARDKAFNLIDGVDITVHIEGPEGKKQLIEAQALEGSYGQYVAEYNTDQDGIYRISTQVSKGGEILSENQKWHWRQASLAEYFSVRQNKEWLKRIAEETGGSYLSLPDSVQLPGILERENKGIVRQQSLSLWDMPLFFLLLISLKLGEWLLRLYWGRL